ncbi:MAG: VOC family protein, partial [Psychromonas sp.]
VVVSPTNSKETKLLITQASTPLQMKEISDQTESRIFLYLHSNDFWHDYEHFKAKGVRFLEKPHVEDYGTVVVFADLYGNKWDLLQLNETIVAKNKRFKD